MRAGPATILSLVEDARRRLAAAPFRPPGREAALLLGRVLGLTEAEVLARDDRPVEQADVERFEALLARRLRGEPVAYLLGEREFYGRPFAVDPRALIPRPETEHLIEEALQLELPEAPRILDGGTGSGAIAVTRALELPAARVAAVDLSPAALAVAATNVRRHHVGDRVRLAATDLARGLALERFDLVVSNPPYVDPADRATLSPEITRFEPAVALFAPGTGESILVRLLSELDRLPSGTPLVLEIGQDQAERLETLAAGSPFELHRIRPDLAGIPRVATLTRA